MEGYLLSTQAVAKKAAADAASAATVSPDTPNVLHTGPTDVDVAVFQTVLNMS